MYIAKVDNNNSGTRLLLQNSSTKEIEYRDVSSLPSGGGYTFEFATVSVYSIAATSGEIVVLAYPSVVGGNIIVQLPTPVANMKIHIKYAEATSVFKVTVDGVTTNIDGSLTAELKEGYESITLITDTIDWYVI